MSYPQIELIEAAAKRIVSGSDYNLVEKKLMTVIASKYNNILTKQLICRIKVNLRKVVSEYDENYLVPGMKVKKYKNWKKRYIPNFELSVDNIFSETETESSSQHNCNTIKLDNNSIQSDNNSLEDIVQEQKVSYEQSNNTQEQKVSYEQSNNTHDTSLMHPLTILQIMINMKKLSETMPPPEPRIINTDKTLIQKKRAKNKSPNQSKKIKKRNVIKKINKTNGISEVLQKTGDTSKTSEDNISVEIPVRCENSVCETCVAQTTANKNSILYVPVLDFTDLPENIVPTFIKSNCYKKSCPFKFDYDNNVCYCIYF